MEIRCQGVILPYKVLDKNPRVHAGAIVENKRLGAALTFIREQQDIRDQKRMKSKRLTKRQKKRIEQQMVVSNSAGVTGGQQLELDCDFTRPVEGVATSLHP